MQLQVMFVLYLVMMLALHFLVGNPKFSENSKEASFPGKIKHAFFRHFWPFRKPCEPSLGLGEV
jgi:hypothetical protein